MIAIEVYINGEKKCVAGTNDGMFSAIVNVARYPHMSIGGMIEKEGISHYVSWPRESLQIGDEVRIRLIEADEVDPPQTETPYETQAEKDEDVRSRLLDVRAMLPSSPQESENATIALFEERMEQQNFAVAMHILSELGEQNRASASYWKELGEVAHRLTRYEESRKYREIERALTPKDEDIP